MVEYYASIHRCEDIDETSLFEFNSEEMAWRNFCERMKEEWDYKKSKSITEKQQLIFLNLWKLAGRRICDESTKAGREMIYLDYSRASIEFSQQSQPETQFVIAIDGSSSMNGVKWREQLDSLRKILSDLSSNPSNHVSIVVFDSRATVFCENRGASSINVNAIQYPGGGTSAAEAFNQANVIMKRYLARMSLHFVYLSDG